MHTETEGIVLKQVNISGSRRIIHIFTQKYGKVSVGSNLIEKNKRTRSSLATRPFTYGRYELFKNNNYYALNGASVIKSFYGFSENLDRYLTASFVLELSSKLLEEEHPQPRLFANLIDLMKLIETRTRSYDTLKLAYMVKLLDSLGMMPHMDKCVSCGTHDAVLFSVADGGSICQRCKEGANGRLIFTPSFDIVNVINYFAKKPIKAFEKIELSDDNANELMLILRKYFEYHLDVEKLKSESML